MIWMFFAGLAAGIITWQRKRMQPATLIPEIGQRFRVGSKILTCEYYWVNHRRCDSWEKMCLSEGFIRTNRPGKYQMVRPEDISELIFK